MTHPLNRIKNNDYNRAVTLPAMIELIAASSWAKSRMYRDGLFLARVRRRGDFMAAKDNEDVGKLGQ